ncbi:YveK family protein [Paenibacillus turpanensis]|uniref:YveK family protein n=1 Tax=Paenibacillus turpanensis TaxID=2689078 RepID=UPI001408B1FB|nr:Wzz/FepE/Etk N-terminal domain-containing protein [Paenibacillus turpanensis]
MDTVELKDIFKIIRKRIWLIVVCVIVVSLFTTIFSYFFVKPMYQASAKLIVNNSEKPQVAGQTLNYNEMNANILVINTYKEIIKSAAIMDQVVQKYPQLNLTPNQLIAMVKVGSVPETMVMNISVVDYSYERAMNIVNAVAQVFKEAVPSIIKVDNVQILNEAKMLANPPTTTANPIQNIVLSAVVALMLAVGLSLLLEYLDDTVKTDEDINRLIQTPTLASIATISSKDLQSRRNNPLSKNLKEAPYATANQ